MRHRKNQRVTLGQALKGATVALLVVGIGALVLVMALGFGMRLLG